MTHGTETIHTRRCSSSYSSHAPFFWQAPRVYGLYACLSCVMPANNLSKRNSVRSLTEAPALACVPSYRALIRSLLSRSAPHASGRSSPNCRAQTRKPKLISANAHWPECGHTLSALSTSRERPREVGLKRALYRHGAVHQICRGSSQ